MNLHFWVLFEIFRIFLQNISENISIFALRQNKVLLITMRKQHFHCILRSWCLLVTLLSALFNSQFNYIPLIWMFCSRSLNNRLNRVHERSLRIAYDDYISSFEQLQEKDDTTNIHQQNLRTLATEMYKVSKNLSPLFIRELFTEKEVTYNTRSNVFIDVDDNDKTHCTKKMNFKIPKANTTHFGLETIRRISSIIWSFVLRDMKNAKSLNIFKTQVNCFTFDKCPCKVYKQHVQGIK